MNSIEIAAGTVEEAVEMALEKLKLTREEVEIEILEAPSKGFLGILGQKKAKVRVTSLLEPLSKLKEFLEKVVCLMGLDVKMEMITTDPEYVKFNFVGKKLGVLIGRRGDTLDALQYLANLVVNKYNYQLGNTGERIKIILDAENYRRRREEALIRLAERMADRVHQTGRKVVFEPMNPQERRIIHTALQDDEGIRTVSEGLDPFRRVIIKKN
jgi:spoIIIJ-associated protein